jgi:uncharacterized protein (TIGR00369 family)
VEDERSMTGPGPQDGPAAFDRMREQFENTPIHKLVGLKAPDGAGEPGTATVEIPLTANAFGSTGNLHGGVIALMCDVACAAAAHGAARYDPTSAALVTADLHIRYLGLPKGDAVRAEAKVVKAGSTLIVVQAEVKDGEDRVIAVADFSAMVVPFRAPLEVEEPAR